MVNYTTNMAAGVEKFETYQGKTLKIPPFNDGMLIQRTPNFAVVYGYKKGLDGQEKGQRTFVVATNAIAGEILNAAARKHGNVIDTMDIPDQDGKPWLSLPAIRYQGSTSYLLGYLNRPQGQSASVLGRGVESFPQLENSVRQTRELLQQLS